MHDFYKCSAAAIGKASVVLFGPTDPELWSPQDPNSLILSGGRKGVFPSFAVVCDAVRESLGRGQS